MKTGAVFVLLGIALMIATVAAVKNPISLTALHETPAVAAP